MSLAESTGMATAVIHGLSHVDLPVRDLDQALAIYERVLGFTSRTRGEGHVDLDAGTVTLRLVLAPEAGRRVTLRVQAGTVEAAFDALVRAGCTAVHAAERSPERECLASLRDPDGHTLLVWRPLTEDEYDVVPGLPKELQWTEDAEHLLQSLLKSVPALFRGLARRKVVRVAEELAGARRVVTREEVVRGLILASPRITRGRNRKPLVEHGIDVERYQADWDAD